MRLSHADLKRLADAGIDVGEPTSKRAKKRSFAKSVPIAFHGLPTPIPEYRFHPSRRWRFDFAWPERMIALEIEGGVWQSGRHTRPSGFLGDIEKYNAAAAMGWRVFRCTPADIKSGKAAAMMREVIG